MKNLTKTSIWQPVFQWVDSEANTQAISSASSKVNWVRCIPFILLHLGCLGVIWVGWNPTAVLICLFLYFFRMFAVTAFYHRYFSHRTFKTNRFWQFIFAVLGNTACQRGPLWWAAHHRQHHRLSDKEGDLHSPVTHSFWYSHVGWFMSDKAFPTQYSYVKDLNKFPELRFLNRFDSLVPALFAMSLFAIGECLAAFAPALETTGLQLVIWGFFISTVLLFHGTFTINSLGHVWGRKRFATKDQSRNNPYLALITLGEGWHNNHHRCPGACKQGFYWWELDITYCILKLMSWVGIVSHLNPVPVRILEEGKAKRSS